MDESSAAQKNALREMRTLLGQFVRGELEAAQFIPSYKRLFAPFDPPDLTTMDLSESAKREFDLFLLFYGGWFGEHDDKIPRRTSWTYGQDQEPYAWIDGPAFRQWIRRTAEEAGIDL